MTTWRMRIACWIPKATNTHSEYVILTVFPLQQWLHEHASMLRATNIASLVKTPWHLISVFPEENFGSFIPLCWPATAHSYILPDDGQYVWQKYVVENKRWMYRVYVLCFCGLCLLVTFDKLLSSKNYKNDRFGVVMFMFSVRTSTVKNDYYYYYMVCACCM